MPAVRIGVPALLLLAATRAASAALSHVLGPKRERQREGNHIHRSLRRCEIHAAQEMRVVHADQRNSDADEQENHHDPTHEAARSAIFVFSKESHTEEGEETATDPTPPFGER